MTLRCALRGCLGLPFVFACLARLAAAQGGGPSPT